MFDFLKFSGMFSRHISGANRGLMPWSSETDETGRLRGW